MIERTGIGSQVRREGAGYAVSGPSFYVWDEDRDWVIRAASLLEPRNRGGARAKRVLSDGSCCSSKIWSARPETLDI